MVTAFLQKYNLIIHLRYKIVGTTLLLGTIVINGVSYMENSKHIYPQSTQNTQSIIVQEAKEIPVHSIEQVSEETKYELTKRIISDFILKENPKLNQHQADSYAYAIIKESELRGHSPYVQTALLASESSFKVNPKHAISTVYGMGGIYADVWSKTLKKEGIITSDKDLLDPYINIKASAYIVSCYNESNKISRAITKYKGFCSLGIKQANNVMRIANNLKKEEKMYG